jgi:hypoxanthine phosphoribosyltransferase
VSEALARTAGLLQDDLDALDAWAAAVLASVNTPTATAEGGCGGIHIQPLVDLPRAVRTRVLRGWLQAAGAGPLTAERTAAVDALLIDWRGQGPIQLPGGVSVHRSSGRLEATPTHGSRRKVSELDADIEETLISAEDIEARIAELAKEIDADYAGKEPVLVGVLKGAAMFMSDLARALERPSTMEFMAVSSYGSGTQSSGVVRILKDLDRDIAGQDVLIVEDIIDSGLTLSWLLKNLSSRNPASISIVTLLRKPDAVKVDVDVKYVGFDIPNEFVVGYGLDYAERYRDLPYIGRLKPAVYGG